MCSRSFSSLPGETEQPATNFTSISQMVQSSSVCIFPTLSDGDFLIPLLKEKDNFWLRAITGSSIAHSHPPTHPPHEAPLGIGVRKVPDCTGFSWHPKQRLWGAFHLSLAKSCSQRAVQVPWLESVPAQCSVGLRFALTRTHRVWEVPLGNEVTAWHGRFMKDLPRCVSEANFSNGKQPGFLRRITACQLFSDALRCVTFFLFSKSECGKLFSYFLFFPFKVHRIGRPDFSFPDYIPFVNVQHNCSVLAPTACKESPDK